MGETKRAAHIDRTTGETKISLDLKLDEPGRGKISSGSGFLDHMLDLFQVHCGCTLALQCDGDFEVDMHHSVEDIGICLGQALAQALGDKKGIERYGFYLLPMDDSLARVALDFSGRFACEFHASFASERIGNLDTELVKHFFHSLAENARMTLHVDLLRGGNTHHDIEGIFKAFARSVAMAVSPARRTQGLPSSKGVL